MPVVIHWVLNLCLGLRTARAVRLAPGLWAASAPWPLLFLAALQAVVVTPCVTYLFRYWPAWSMFYLFDPVDYPMLETFIGLLSGLVVLINFGLMWLGFVCGRRSVAQGTHAARWAQLPYSISIAIVGLCVAYLGDRMMYAGDFQTFWRGEASLWFATPAGWVGFALIFAGVAFERVLHHRFAARDPVFL